MVGSKGIKGINLETHSVSVEEQQARIIQNNEKVIWNSVGRILRQTQIYFHGSLG